MKGKLPMKKLIISGIILSLLLLGSLVLALRAQGPHIQGKSDQYGWEIDVQGSAGTFKIGDESWRIEFLYKWFGQGGYANSLWFLGRKPDNYILVFVFANTAGDSFYIWWFDYKKATSQADTFSGAYSISGMQIRPTLMEEYVPAGKVPDYLGQDFRISSNYSQITPAEGQVAYERLQLKVYPVYNVVISSTWSEFWMIGVDSKTNRIYHLIYYSNRHQTWVIDLWSGQISLLPLGQAILTDGQTQASHSVTLSGK